MRPDARGFTLVELIVVIVILGILAATALPRFINITRDARVAAVNGVAGGLRSAMAVAQARWQSTGGSGAAVSMVGAPNVTVNNTTGVPTNDTDGIVAAMGCTGTPCSGVAVANLGGATSNWAPANAPANCMAIYDPSGTVTTDVSGC